MRVKEGRLVEISKAEKYSKVIRRRRSDVALKTVLSIVQSVEPF